MQDKMSDILIKKMATCSSSHKYEELERRLNKSESRKIVMFNLKKEFEKMINKHSPSGKAIDPKKQIYVSKQPANGVVMTALER